MLYGTVAMAVLWFGNEVSCTLAGERSAVFLAGGWLAVSLLAWTQALT